MNKWDLCLILLSKTICIIPPSMVLNKPFLWMFVCEWSFIGNIEINNSLD